MVNFPFINSLFNRRFRSGLAAVLILFLSFPAQAPASGFLQSAFLSADQIVIPPNLGTVQERHQSGNGRPLIIHIQDAHGVLDAQRSIRSLLLYLEEHAGVRSVALEGAKGKMDPTLLQAFPEARLREKILSEYLQRGEIAGAALAAIDSKNSADYRGIENWNAYQKNYEAYLRAKAEEKSLLEKLELLGRDVDRRRKNVYNPQLEEFHEKRDAFESGRNNLLDFFRLLQNHVKEKAFSAPLLPELKEIFDLLDQEEASLKEENQNRLAVKGESTTKPRKSFELKDREFFAKLANIIDEVESRLSRSPEENALLKEYRRLRLFKKMAGLELTREEWDEIKKERAFLNEHSTLRRISHAWEYYEWTEKRDAYLSKNLNLFMENRKTPSVVVTGGFHTDGLKRKWLEQGYSYVLIAPKMENTEGQETYGKIMRGEFSFKKYFRGTFYDAFMREAVQRLTRDLNEPDFENCLRRWRSGLFARLAADNRLPKASQYMDYLDGALKNYIEKFGVQSWDKRSEEKEERLLHETLAGGIAEALKVRNRSAPSELAAAGSLAVLIPALQFTKKSLNKTVLGEKETSFRSELRAKPLSKLQIDPTDLEILKKWLRFQELKQEFPKGGIWAVGTPVAQKKRDKPVETVIVNLIPQVLGGGGQKFALPNFYGGRTETLRELGFDENGNRLFEPAKMPRLLFHYVEKPQSNGSVTKFIEIYHLTESIDLQEKNEWLKTLSETSANYLGGVEIDVTKELYDSYKNGSAEIKTDRFRRRYFQDADLFFDAVIAASKKPKKEMQAAAEELRPIYLALNNERNFWRIRKKMNNEKVLNVIERVRTFFQDPGDWSHVSFKASFRQDPLSGRYFFLVQIRKAKWNPAAENYIDGEIERVIVIQSDHGEWQKKRIGSAASPWLWALGIIEKQDIPKRFYKKKMRVWRRSVREEAELFSEDNGLRPRGFAYSGKNRVMHNLKKSLTKKHQFGKAAYWPVEYKEEGNSRWVGYIDPTVPLPRIWWFELATEGGALQLKAQYKRFSSVEELKKERATAVNEYLSRKAPSLNADVKLRLSVTWGEASGAESNWIILQYPTLEKGAQEIGRLPWQESLVIDYNVRKNKSIKFDLTPPSEFIQAGAKKPFLRSVSGRFGIAYIYLGLNGDRQVAINKFPPAEIASRKDFIHDILLEKKFSMGESLNLLPVVQRAMEDETLTIESFTRGRRLLPEGFNALTKAGFEIDSPALVFTVQEKEGEEIRLNYFLLTPSGIRPVTEDLANDNLLHLNPDFFLAGVYVKSYEVYENLLKTAWKYPEKPVSDETLEFFKGYGIFDEYRLIPDFLLKFITEERPSENTRYFWLPRRKVDGSLDVRGETLGITHPKMAGLIEKGIAPFVKEDDLLLEIGPGSGFLTKTLAEALIARGLKNKIVAIEKSENTFERVKDRLENLYPNIEVREGDLFGPVKKREKFAAIIWNPPWYSETGERPGKSMATIDIGHHNLKKSLQEAPKFLAEGGAVYLIFPERKKDVLAALAEETSMNLTHLWDADKNLHYRSYASRRQGERFEIWIGLYKLTPKNTSELRARAAEEMASKIERRIETEKIDAESFLLEPARTRGKLGEILFESLPARSESEVSRLSVRIENNLLGYGPMESYAAPEDPVKVKVFWQAAGQALKSMTEEKGRRRIIPAVSLPSREDSRQSLYSVLNGALLEISADGLILIRDKKDPAPNQKDFKPAVPAAQYAVDPESPSAAKEIEKIFKSVSGEERAVMTELGVSFPAGAEEQVTVFVDLDRIAENEMRQRAAVAALLLSFRFGIDYDDYRRLKHSEWKGLDAFLESRGLGFLKGFFAGRDGRLSLLHTFTESFLAQAALESAA